MKRQVILLGIFISFIACDDIVEGDNISKESVILLAPMDQAVLDITTLMFSWQAVETAENYHIQIATPTFGEALQIVKDTTVTTTIFLTSLEVMDYEWRVRAENSGYQTAYTIQSFSIEE